MKKRKIEFDLCLLEKKYNYEDTYFDINNNENNKKYINRYIIRV